MAAWVGNLMPEDTSLATHARVSRFAEHIGDTWSFYARLMPDGTPLLTFPMGRKGTAHYIERHVVLRPGADAWAEPMSHWTN